MNELIIYKQLNDLQYYLYLLYIKYPKSEKVSLVVDIKKAINNIKRYIIKAYRNNERLKNLKQIDEEIMLLNDYMRISYKLKYISHQNYLAYSRKITSISNLLGSWIIKCQKP